MRFDFTRIKLISSLTGLVIQPVIVKLSLSSGGFSAL